MAVHGGTVGRIDVGIVIDRFEPMLSFWQQVVGLPFENLLLIGQGLRQHRHGMNGSVFKLNHSRDPLEQAPTSPELLNRGQRRDLPPCVEAKTSALDQR